VVEHFPNHRSEDSKSLSTSGTLSQWETTEWKAYVATAARGMKFLPVAPSQSPSYPVQSACCCSWPAAVDAVLDRATANPAGRYRPQAERRCRLHSTRVVKVGISSKEPVEIAYSLQAFLFCLVAKAVSPKNSLIRSLSSSRILRNTAFRPSSDP